MAPDRLRTRLCQPHRHQEMPQEKCNKSRSTGGSQYSPPQALPRLMS